jgi:hypothetical protein
MDGREKTPEAEAEAIINSSDESVSDLVGGTEIDLDDEQLDALNETGGDLDIDFGDSSAELDFDV